MIITKTFALFLTIYFKLNQAATGIRQERSSQAPDFNVVQRSTDDTVKVNPGIVNVWTSPDESNGQHFANSCQYGNTCLMNKAPTPQANPIERRNSFNGGLHSRKRTGHPHEGKNEQLGPCLGLEKQDKVGLQSIHTKLYLASCEDCVNAKYRNMAMVYRSYGGDEGMWKLTPEGARCTIKNIKTGMYLSRCSNCTSEVSNLPLVSLYRDTINEGTNDEMWILERHSEKTYGFKSASSGEYLGVCPNCLTSNSTVTDPGALFKTDRDNSFVVWGVNIDVPEEAIL
ncbi:hypothetical protein NEMIN01_1204 [Nematocida minor]|uniref:uncharacterized protein n=1 Tax=Nematocida minor TaxID=1912983 RepID=UPI0022201F71|nr:uncharacterized protein NEMIN01_1204 [Nematocida minor]KAI5190802.1 hypothetical protein NEMIN01_1204 [Nematocida minor]